MWTVLGSNGRPGHEGYILAPNRHVRPLESTADRFFLSDPLRCCILGLAAICCLHAGQHEAHARQAPLVETRGVWFATVLGDGGWPTFPSDPAGVQEAELRSIIREIHALDLIVDVTGREIHVGTVGDAGSLDRRLAIDMSGFATGVYVLVVRAGSEVDSRRVVVTR